MDDYIKILNISKISSLNLIAIAYVTTLKHAVKKQMNENIINKLHLAYHLASKHRSLLFNWESESKKNELDNVISSFNNLLKNGQYKTPINSSLNQLRAKYILRSLLLGPFSIILSMIISPIGDFVFASMSFSCLIASFGFFFGILNLAFQWFNCIISIIVILTSISMILLYLRSFERDTIKNLENINSNF